MLSTAPFGLPLASVSGISIIWIAVAWLLIMFVIAPLSLLLNAGVYQLFAKILFHMFSKPYSNTFTALVYGVMPMLLLVWLLAIPVVGIIAMIAIVIWSFIVTIISMARQQQVSGAMAFLGMFVSSILFSVIVGVVMFIMVLILGTMALGFILGAMLPSLSSTGASAHPYPISINSASTPAIPYGSPGSSGPASTTSIYNAASQQTSLANVTPVDSYSYTGTFNNVKVTLERVQGITVEALPDASNVGMLFNFSTNNPKFSCLDNSALNVWVAPSEYPGYYVMHNGAQGSQCAYITMIIPKSEMTAP
ncbi:MAG: hypothetical protein ACP5HW_03550 [Candidatus Micrarchaeia archaeon]